MNNLLVIGSLNMDFLIEIQRMPEAGETVMGKEYLAQAGGKGANQAYAAGKLGAKVSMIGKVGDDSQGKHLLENLQMVGVDTSGIEISEAHPTGQAFVLLEETGENRIVVIPGANLDIQTEMIDRHTKLIDECDVVVMQLEIPLDVVIYAAKEAKKRGKIVILDPAPATGVLPDELLKNVDIIKPNETELEEISGVQVISQDDVKKAAEKLLEKGTGAVVATRGNQGAVVVAKDYVETFPAMQVSVVDTTAAGDSFTAALAVLVTKDSFRQAITFANLAASYTVQRKGAQSSVPSMEEIKN